jgi:fucose permease
MNLSTTLTKPSKHFYTLAYFALFVLLGMAASATGPALLSLADQTASQIGEIGSLFAASSLGYMAGSLAGGWAYDRVRGHKLIAAALVFTAITLALIPFIGSLALLVGVMFLAGAGQGTLDVGGNLLLVWVHRLQVTSYLNGLHFSFGLGAMLIPLIVAQGIQRMGGIAPAYGLMALAALPLAIYVLSLPSPDRPDESAGGQPAADGSREKQSTNWMLVGLLSLVFFTYVGAEAGFGGWIFTYATRLNLGDVATAGALTSAYWGALMIGRLVMIPIGHRFRPEHIVLVDFAGCLAALAGILIFPASYALVWTGAVVFGFFNGPIFPTLLSFAGQRMTLSGNATRWFFVGTGAGGMFLPWVMGQLFASVGPASVMWAILIDLAFGLVLFGWMAYRMK